MSEELEVLKLVTGRLGKANINYIISGSIAANYYTVPRMTRDIDIVIELKNADIENFIQNFQQDFYVDHEIIKNEVRSRGMFNLIHKEYALKVDFIVHKNSEFQESSFLRKKKVVVDGISVWIISPEDLIIAKLLWAKDSYSELQLNDISNLMKTVDSLDKSYIENWTRKLGLEYVYKRVKL